MDLRYILSIGLCFLASGASGETMVVKPDPCPAAANAPLVIDLGSMDGAEIGGGRENAGHILVIYAPLRAGWARQRLFARFEIDPEAPREEAGGQPRPCVRKVN
jgi:hypothetical protein